MKAQHLRSGTKIEPYKLSVREMPHLVLEPTMRCNMQCRSCYNRDRGITKPLADIKAEIELGRSKRNLETVSILGGEPTLHPDLPEIISYIKDRRLTCEMLTNGIRFLDNAECGMRERESSDGGAIPSREREASDGGALLDRIVAAGLDRIVFHVDPGQRHEENDAICRQLFDMAEARRLYFAISITVYAENRASIPETMKRYAHYRFFDGILATLTRDPEVMARPSIGPTAHRLPPAANRPESEATGADRSATADASPDLLPLETEYEAISQRLQIEPATYVPTSLSDEDISWLMYFYFINHRTGRTFDISPGLNRFFRGLFRFLTGRYMFGTTLNPALFPATFLGATLLELLVKPGRAGRVRQLLADSDWLRNLRLQYIVIQQGPEFNHERGKVQMCYHCPDATIRNGKLTPVCVADRINPLSGTRDSAYDELYRTVYEHLEEI